MLVGWFGFNDTYNAIEVTLKAQRVGCVAQR